MHSRLAVSCAALTGETFDIDNGGRLSRRARSLAAIVGIALSLLFAAPLQAQTIDAHKTVTYVTAAGDTLYEVAQRYLSDVRGWRELAGLNHVSAPRRLPAGIALRLPLALLRRDAMPVSVIATSGPVMLRSRDAVARVALAPAVPLLVGRVLGENDAVSTGPNGFATLELADGSYVSLTPNTSIVLSILRKMALTGINERVIELEHGEVSNEVTHAKQPGDRFEIQTPSIVAGVRGTHFRVQIAPSMTAVEVLDGKVALGVTKDAVRPETSRPAAGTAQLVAAGEGSATPTGGDIGAPLPLLPSPALVDPGKVQDGQAVTFDLEPEADARAYRVQIARDADLLDLIRDTRVQAPTAVFTDVPDGTYFVRVSAIDSHGLEGLPRVYAFERRANQVDTAAEPTNGSHEYRFLWRASRADTAGTRFRVMLSHHRDLRDPVVDAVDLTATSLVVSRLPPGDYYWCVIAEQYEDGRFYQTIGPVREFTLAH